MRGHNDRVEGVGKKPSQSPRRPSGGSPARAESSSVFRLVSEACRPSSTFFESSQSQMRTHRQSQKRTAWARRLSSRLKT